MREALMCAAVNRCRLALVAAAGVGAPTVHMFNVNLCFIVDEECAIQVEMSHAPAHSASTATQRGEDESAEEALLGNWGDGGDGEGNAAPRRRVVEVELAVSPPPIVRPRCAVFDSRDEAALEATAWFAAAFRLLRWLSSTKIERHIDGTDWIGTKCASGTASDGEFGR